MSWRLLSEPVQTQHRTGLHTQCYTSMLLSAIWRAIHTDIIPCRNRQFRPSTSIMGYPVRSRNPWEANMMGLSGMEGSVMMKDFCWACMAVTSLKSIGFSTAVEVSAAQEVIMSGCTHVHALSTRSRTSRGIRSQFRTVSRSRWFSIASRATCLCNDYTLKAHQWLYLNSDNSSSSSGSNRVLKKVLGYGGSILYS